MADEGLWKNQSMGFYGNSSSGTINTSRKEAKEDIPSPLPPPPPPQETSSKKRGRDGSSGVTKSKKAKKGGGSEEGCEEKHDIHIMTERERRKKMRDMFINLRALVPTLASKADKSTIVDEAVAYIKSLESTLYDLEKKKKERQQLGISYQTGQEFVADQGLSSLNEIGSLINPSSNLNSLPKNRFPVGFQVWTSLNVVLTICGDEAQFTVCSAKKFGTLSFILFLLDKYNVEVLTANVSSDANRNIFMIQTRARGAAQGELKEFFSVEDIYKKVANEIMQWTTAS